MMALSLLLRKKRATPDVKRFYRSTVWKQPR